MSICEGNACSQYSFSLCYVGWVKTIHPLKIPNLYYIDFMRLELGVRRNMSSTQIVTSYKQYLYDVTILKPQHNNLHPSMKTAAQISIVI